MTTNIPTVCKAMTPFPHSVTPDTPIARAHELMSKYGIRHLPIKNDDDEITGMLSHRDLELALVLASRVDISDEVNCEEVCSPDPYVVEMGTPLRDVLDTMAKRHIGSTLVTKEGKLVGIFTTTDACTGFRDLISDIESESELPDIPS